METAGLAGEVRVFPDPETTSEALAAALAQVVTRSLAGSPRFTLVLPGGETPRPLFRILAAQYRAEFEEIGHVAKEGAFIGIASRLGVHHGVRE